MPGDGFASGFCTVGVDGAVCIGVGNAFDTVDTAELIDVRAGVGMRDVAVDDIAAQGKDL